MSSASALGLAAIAKAQSYRPSEAPVFAVLGDSISYYNTGGVSAVYAGRGYLTQARALLGNRFAFPTSNNFGVSGETSTQILARVGQVIAAKPDWCAVMAGTNDLNDDLTAKETTWSNIQAIYTALMNAGIVVLALPITPRNSYNALAGTPLADVQKKHQWINRQIRNYAATGRSGRFYVADTDSATLNRASNVGGIISGASTDGLHPSYYGGCLLGQAIYNVLVNVIPPLTTPCYSQLDIYDSALNPTGNRLTGPIGALTGSAGTAGTGATGSVATSWNTRRSVGSFITATCSKVTRSSPGGGEVQQIVVGASGVGAVTETIYCDTSIAIGATTYAIGDAVVAEVELTGSGLSLVQAVYLQLVNVGGTSITNYGLQSTGITADRELASFTKTVQTPPLVVPTGSTALTIRVVIEAECDGSAPAGTIQIGSASIRSLS